MTRRKLQPTAERYREQLVLAADRIIELQTPWWLKARARILGMIGRMK